MEKKHVVLFPILLFSGLISYSTLTAGHNWGGDFSAYIMQANSIVERNMQYFIDCNTFTIDNSSWVIGPVVCPWGFPLLLAPVLHIFGLNLIALKCVNILFFGLFLICIFFLFSRYLSDIETILIVSLFAFNPVLLSFLDNILSDIPFIFFSTLSILLTDRFTLSDSKPIALIFGYILLGIAIFFAYFIRQNGFLLLLTLLVCQIVQISYLTLKRRQNLGKILACNIIPYLIFFSLIGFCSLIFPTDVASGISYLKRVTIGSIIDNIDYYSELLEIFFKDVPCSTIIYIATLTLALIGVLVNIRDKYHFIIYCLLTLMLFILYPVQQGIRYIFPIIPFYIYFAFAGMKRILENSQRLFNLRHILTITPWFIILVFFLKGSLISARANLNKSREISGPFARASTDMFNFVSEHTESNSIIVFFRPRVMRMITSRNSIMIDNNCIDLIKGDYYVFHKYMGDCCQISLEEISKCDLPIEVESIFDNDKFIVYKLNREHNNYKASGCQ